jgi:ubiquinone biosynthesis monooxygenase Coq7
MPRRPRKRERIMRLPGDPSRQQEIARMIRVDQAGEYGAVRIYEGQLAVLAPGRAERTVRAMAAKEAQHLESFNRLLVRRRVRPTALEPLWRLTGYALGAGTALLGERTAMACTAAVEEVIGEHYRRQIERLAGEEPGLRSMIEDYRADELAHREKALAQGAEAAPAYPLIAGAIKAGTRLAIWLSTRI